SGYEPDELPGCSTPRLKRGKFYAFWTEFANNAGIWYRRRDVKSAFSILIVDPTCQPNFGQGNKREIFTKNAHVSFGRR
ncbi:hypothetical protein, partial [Enterobacter hormaechei]|uniref:hypothetical protein n=1 Tax=Enterobacter hormaechei TaxID=158836 RepID=UPI0019552AF4